MFGILTRGEVLTTLNDLKGSFEQYSRYTKLKEIVDDIKRGPGSGPNAANIKSIEPQKEPIEELKSKVINAHKKSEKLIKKRRFKNNPSLEQGKRLIEQLFSQGNSICNLLDGIINDLIRSIEYGPRYGDRKYDSYYRDVWSRNFSQMARFEGQVRELNKIITNLISFLESI